MKSIILSTKLCLILSIALVLSSLKCGSTENNSSDSPANKTTTTAILSEKQFNELFPMRDKFYSYAAFIKAAREMDMIKVKVVRRAVSVYQFTRTDKSTGKSSIIRQDEDWNEEWAKKKPDSTYVIDYGNFCAEK